MFNKFDFQHNFLSQKVYTRFILEDNILIMRLKLNNYRYIIQYLVINSCLNMEDVEVTLLLVVTA